MCAPTTVLWSWLLSNTEKFSTILFPTWFIKNILSIRMYMYLLISYMSMILSHYDRSIVLWKSLNWWNDVFPYYWNIPMATLSRFWHNGCRLVVRKFSSSNFYFQKNMTEYISHAQHFNSNYTKCIPLAISKTSPRRRPVYVMLHYDLPLSPLSWLPTEE